MIFRKSIIVSIKVSLLKTKQILHEHYNKALQLLPLCYISENQIKHSDAATYYTSVFLISNLVYFYNQSFRAKIISKSIIYHMLKPIHNYPKYRFSIDLISNIYSFFIGILEILFLTKFFGFKSILNNVNSLEIVLLIIYLCLGTIIGYLLYISISQIVFWINNFDLQSFFFYQVLLFFSGFYISIDYMPKIIQKTILLSPFPFLFYYPINVILKREFNYTNTILIGIFWIIFLYFIALFIWKKGSDAFYD